MRYVNLDIELVEEAGAYRLLVTPPAETGAPLMLELAPFHAAFAADLERLRQDDGDQAYYRDLGGRLFATLFGGQGRALLDGLLKRQREQGGGVCVRLRLSQHARMLPWEFMFRPDWNAFVGAAIESPLVRFLDTPKPIAGFCVQLPLRMLVLAPAAAWRQAGEHVAAGLDSRTEVEDLRDLARGLAGQLDLTVLDADVSFRRVSELLREQAFEIVHFIGHGSFRGGSARLQLDDEEGGEEPVDEDRWAQLFANLPAVKLVFLNACESATVSNLNAVHGMAPSLVQQGVPAVVAMQYEIQDAAAIGFARTFYHSLFRGSERGRVDVAINLARSRLVGEYADQREFGAPVLYTRAPAGVLFDAPGTKAPGLLIAPADAGRVLAIEQTLASNVAKGEADSLHGADAADDMLALARLRKMLRRSNLLYALLLTLPLLALANSPWIEWIHLKLQTAIVGLHEWLVPVRLAPSLRLIEVDKEATPAAFRKPWDSREDWRADHARLIERLSAAGARTVAFNLNLPGPKPGDMALEAAIRAAAARGTAVVFGPRNSDTDAALPNLRAAFIEAGALWGTACARINSGIRIDDSTKKVERGFATGLAIAALPALPAIPARPALGLVAAFPGYAIADIDFNRRAMRLSRQGDPTPLTVRFSEETPEAPEPVDCSLIAKGTRTADLLVAFPSLSHLRERTEPYHEVAHPDAQPDLRRYRDATVIVGSAARIIPVARVGGDETISGAAFHAAVINALWGGDRVIARLPPYILGMVGLALAAFGAAWRLIGPGGNRRIARPVHVISAVTLTTCIATLCAFVIYSVFDRLFNVMHVIGIGLMGYALADWLRRLWVAPTAIDAIAKP
jgi:CHASE2 domain-containing sensor protein